ncbi:MAG: formylglycine-generating enzyme family protein [Gemmatirosa sp.]
MIQRAHTAVGMAARDLVRIPAGSISLRDEGTKRTWSADLAPFLLSRHLITRKLYASLVGSSPSTPASSPLTPVTDVSWIDAVGFCNLLSREAGLAPCYVGIGSADADEVVCDASARGYRLPTEAEWEYACRAGSYDTRYGELDAIAWYDGNSGGVIHDVGTRQPNAWGLHDMIGNAWEWCWDVFDPVVYGPYRVLRGGGFSDPPRGCRASCRRKSHPTFHIDDVGFRIARCV